MGRQRPWLTASAAIDVPLAASRSFALVIGNGAYKHVDNLRGAPRDAQAVGDALKAIGYRTTTLIDADGDAVAKAIDDFENGLKDGDSAILYYAGHGFSVNGVGYLPSLSAEPTDAATLVRSSIPVDSLIGGMTRAGATRKILVLDTHYPPLPAIPSGR